jgi:hypothetical protein
MYDRAVHAPSVPPQLRQELLYQSQLKRTQLLGAFKGPALPPLHPVTQLSVWDDDGVAYTYATTLSHTILATNCEHCVRTG